MYTTEGIILARTNAGEADAIFSIYTKDFGKIRAAARGIKKEGAKLKGHLEPLSQSNIVFVLGKSGERLTHASLLQFFSRIRETYEKTALASYVLALVDQYCFPGEKDERLWDLLCATLQELERSDFDQAAYHAFLAEFEEKFLAVIGYGGESDISILGMRVASPL